MLRKVLLVFGVLVVVLAVIIATRPSTYRVERSTRIAAPPDIVFGLVNDLHAWDRWSPWAKLDPSMKTTYGGPPVGEGATYAWTGNDKVGEGNLRITESRPAQKVGIRLEFIKPMHGQSQTDFTFKPEGGGTQVSWAMSGTNDFMLKAMSAFGDMDAMIGNDFDKGLRSLKAVSEKAAQANAAAAAAAAATPPPTVPSVPAPQTAVPR